MTGFNKTLSNQVFVPAICPSCGGELRVPENHETIKCMYCGVDIVLHTKGTQENKPDLETIAKLAFSAYLGRNYSEAYRYYSMALEIEPHDPSLWAMKGISSAWQSTPTISHLEEGIQCIQESIRLGLASYPEMFAVMVRNFATSVRAYIISVYSNLAKEWEEKRPIINYYYSHLHLNEIKKLKWEIKDKFSALYAEPIYRSAYFLWETLPNQENANYIRGYHMYLMSSLADDGNWILQGVAPDLLLPLIKTINTSSADPYGDHVGTSANDK